MTRARKAPARKAQAQARRPEGYPGKRKAPTKKPKPEPKPRSRVVTWADLLLADADMPDLR